MTTTSHGGVPLRGLSRTPRTGGFSGAFGRMFPELHAASFGANDDANEKNLLKLGAAMSAEADPADPKVGKDDEESGIPALYTYFGQFVDHDLTFDPASSLQRHTDPDALIDFRTPSFDLDNLYGRGPDDQPYMYDDDGKRFLLGEPLAGGNPGAHDLQRNDAKVRRALIGDPRNDENSIVSQLQGVFQRFHNGMVKENKALPFQAVQLLVRSHYQWVVLNDFLPRIVSAKVLDELKTGGRWDPDKIKFYKHGRDAFMPVEFSVAAYRLGHSMVRPGYQLNDAILQAIFPNKGGEIGLTGFKAMLPGWGIDWGRFIDVDVRAYDGDANAKSKRLQFAYRLDTSLVNPLAHLPATVASDPPPSLASRNLLRGWRLGLPSAQEVAHRMGVKPLEDKHILLGMGVDKPDNPLPSIDSVAPAFKNNCPLWTYILAEAMHHKAEVKLPVKEAVTVTTPQLGPVGGRIVAEVFLGLAFADKTSILHRPAWTPGKPDYALKDIVAFALKH